MTARKLTMDDAAEVRRLAAAGMTQTGLARVYGVAQETIWAIVNAHRYTVQAHAVDGYVGSYPSEVAPMPVSRSNDDIAAAALLPTATEASAARHMAAWWEMDARVQAANAALDDAPLAAD